MQLRSYQRDAVHTLLQYSRSEKPVACLPTGSGKSVIIADLVQKLEGNSLVVTHRAELVEQDARAYQDYTGQDPGIFCAGLGKKELCYPVTFGSVQSLHRHTVDFGSWYHNILVDEAHLIPPDSESMYRKLIDKVQPDSLIGMTATPYRMDGGLIFGTNQLFSLMPVNVPVKRLIEGEYLAPIVSLRGRGEIDTSRLLIIGNDFDFGSQCKALDRVFAQAIQDLLGHLNTLRPKRVLVFCPSIAHVKEVHRCLHMALARPDYFIAGVTSEDRPDDRKRAIDRFKRSPAGILVNCEIFTTGFDTPDIDMLVLLRATQSTSLYVQMCGRGMRIAKGKTACTLLDYGQNVVRHGPIDELNIETRVRKGGGGGGVAPIKTCGACRAISPVQARVCPNCDRFFPILDMTTNPTSDEFLGDSMSWKRVVGMERRLHPNKTCVQIVFKTKGKRVYLHLWPGQRAAGVYLRSMGADDTDTIGWSVEDMLEAVRALPRPNSILVDTMTASGWWDVKAVSGFDIHHIPEEIEVMR